MPNYQKLVCHSYLVVLNFKHNCDLVAHYSAVSTLGLGWKPQQEAHTPTHSKQEPFRGPPDSFCLPKAMPLKRLDFHLFSESKSGNRQSKSATSYILNQPTLPGLSVLPRKSPGPRIASDLASIGRLKTFKDHTRISLAV